MINNLTSIQIIEWLILSGKSNLESRAFKTKPKVCQAAFIAALYKSYLEPNTKTYNTSKEYM